MDISGDIIGNLYKPWSFLKRREKRLAAEVARREDSPSGLVRFYEGLSGILGSRVGLQGV